MDDADANSDYLEAFQKAKKIILDKDQWTPKGGQFVTNFTFEELGDNVAPAMNVIFEEQGVAKPFTEVTGTGLGATVHFSISADDLFRTRAKLNSL